MDGVTKDLIKSEQKQILVTEMVNVFRRSLISQERILATISINLEIVGKNI